MTNYLIALKGPDGEVWLKPENLLPLPKRATMIDEDDLYDDLVYANHTVQYEQFERDNPAHPLHTYTLSPGDRVQADGFELVWQERLKRQYRRNPQDNEWQIMSYLAYDNHRKALEINTSSAIETRRAYIPVASKEGEKEERQLPPLIQHLADAIESKGAKIIFGLRPDQIALVEETFKEGFPMEYTFEKIAKQINWDKYTLVCWYVRHLRTLNQHP